MQDDLERFYDSVISVGAYSTVRNLRNHTNYLLGQCKGVKNALDIGGGAGILSFYIASLGAQKVTLLEPEGDGSTSQITNVFQKLRALVPRGDRVHLTSGTFQDFEPEDKFDLVVCANAINHLDEPACVDLRTNPESYATYIGYFERLYSMVSSGGSIVFSDCSPYNFFQLIGVSNPLMPAIEWEKHQSPHQWTTMLHEVGFVNPQIEWSSFNTLGTLGRVMMNNALVNYFTLSHFKFTMTKP